MMRSGILMLPTTIMSSLPRPAKAALRPFSARRRGSGGQRFCIRSNGMPQEQGRYQKSSAFLTFISPADKSQTTTASALVDADMLFIMKDRNS